MEVNVIWGGWMAYCRRCKDRLTEVLITDEAAGLRKAPVCDRCLTPEEAVLVEEKRAAVMEAAVNRLGRRLMGEGN